MTDLPESKSSRKRKALAAQALGAKLARLTEPQLATLPLDAALEGALREYRRLSKREALRRQLQFIGRLMRDADLEALEAAVDAIEHASAASKFIHRASERWRERLLTEPEAITEYVATHPEVDVKALRDLLRQHGAARDDASRKQLARRLFGMLRDAEDPTRDIEGGA